MFLLNLILLPGTLILQRLGVDPDGEAGLLRWMINSFIYLFASIPFLLMFAV